MTSASPGGQIHGVHGDFDLAIEFPGVVEIDFVLDLDLLAEEFFHFGRIGDFAEAVVDFVEAAEDGADVIDGFVDVALDVFGGIELRLLREVAGGEAIGEAGFAFEVFILPGHDAEQRAFAGAVFAEDADFGPGIEGEPDVFEDFLGAVFFGEIGDGVDVFFGHRKFKSRVVNCELRRGEG